jgi:hypothetical protein
MNTHATIEELLERFFTRSVSYRRKVGDYFLPEYGVFFSCLTSRFDRGWWNKSIIAKTYYVWNFG